MAISQARTAAIVGCSALPVTVEVIIKRGGAPKFTIIGLADGAVKESKDRVVSALQQSGLRMPEKILVSLSPAELRKEGSSFDLPIAVGIIAALLQVSFKKFSCMSFHGELGLDGSIRRIKGALMYALAASQSSLQGIFVPSSNASEAAMVNGVSVYGVHHLTEVVQWLEGTNVIDPVHELPLSTKSTPICLNEVIGQERAKRALTIAAAGGHNLLFVGPPGCGKSMLSERIGGLLPPLKDEERLECGIIHSSAGLRIESILEGLRPFRSPHYTVSEAGLIGGGSTIRPGEISLAHRGVLFLDEFPEFRRGAVEALRLPLETGEVHIARARASLKFPAQFQLLAAMNPCPCGRLGGTDTRCVCSAMQIQRYLKQLSQPILDRIDMHVEMQPVSIQELQEGSSSPNQENAMKELIEASRRDQHDRQGCLNGLCILSGDIQWECSKAGKELLHKAAQKRGYSLRAINKIMRVARTIADLERKESISEGHIAEALSLRALDRIATHLGMNSEFSCQTV